MSTLIASTQLRLATAWGQLFDPENPASTLAALGGAAAAWTTSAQAAALIETSGWLRAMLAANGANPAAPTFPAGLVGSTASGASMAQLTGTAPAVYFQRLGSGWPREDAAASSLGWLNRIAGTEPYRAANTATSHVATDDDRFTGRVVRITRPDACEFCKAIADRGYIPAHAGFAAHANCRCTPSPEISSYARSRRSAGRGRAAAAGEPPERRTTPTPPTATNDRAETMPLVGFEKLPASRRAEYEQTIRETIARSLRGIRPEIADKLAGVRIADPKNNPLDRRQGSRALAWFRPSNNGITIRQSTFKDAKLDVLKLQLVPSRESPLSWWPSTIDPSLPQSNSMLKVTTSHEMGHFLDFQLNSAQRTDLTRIISETAEANRDLQPPGDLITRPSRQVSRYAGENQRELVAEAWAEYTLAPQPRPMATAIGDAIVRYLGPSTPGFYAR